MKKIILKIIILTFIFFILYGLIIYFPLIEYHIHSSNLLNSTIINSVKLNDKDFKINNLLDLKQIPKDKNLLIIPKIDVYAFIIEGNSIDILNKFEGVWREPFGTIPGTLGNIIIAGHRWQFLPPNTNTFFLLPQLMKEDLIIVYWKGKQFNYKIYDLYEAYPDDKKPYLIENYSTLTLYTCTPVFIANKRFIVKARLIN